MKFKMLSFLAREISSESLFDYERLIIIYLSIILDDVALTHLTFSQEFTTAVEQKQIAEQQAEQARYKVERANHIKRANIIKAEGDAQAAKLVADVSSLFSTHYFL